MERDIALVSAILMGSMTLAGLLFVLMGFVWNAAMHGDLPGPSSFGNAMYLALVAAVALLAMSAFSAWWLISDFDVEPLLYGFLFILMIATSLTQEPEIRATRAGGN